MPPARSVSHDAIRFGAIIRRVRAERGWTRLKLARRSGMHVNYVAMVEAGRNVPSLVTILELADVLGIDAGELVREVAAGRNVKRGNPTGKA